jgi:hypothetical protein
MNMTKEQIIEKAKKLALSRYNEGYDTFVECYDQKEWEEFVEGMNWTQVQDEMAQMVSLWEEQRGATRFE